MQDLKEIMIKPVLAGAMQHFHTKHYHKQDNNFVFSCITGLKQNIWHLVNKASGVTQNKVISNYNFSL